jgi:hypothetical protein
MTNKCLGLFLMTVAICGAASDKAKISKDLQTADGLSKVKVIIQWKTAPDSAKHARVSSRGGVLHSLTA